MKVQKHNFKTALHLACAKDAAHPAWQQVVFQNGKAVATDAHVVVAQSLSAHGFSEAEIEKLNGWAIQRDVFAQIVKFDRIEIGYGEIVAHKGVTTATFKMVRDGEVGKFPNWQAVLPDGNNTVEIAKTGFSLAIMERIAKITLADDKTVSIRFFGEGRIMLLCGNGVSLEDEVIGLMPCVIKH